MLLNLTHSSSQTTSHHTFIANIKSSSVPYKVRVEPGAISRSILISSASNDVGSKVTIVLERLLTLDVFSTDAKSASPDDLDRKCHYVLSDENTSYYVISMT